jgi:hypothetical protein
MIPTNHPIEGRLVSGPERDVGNWGPRRVTDDELRAAFGSGWRIVSLAPERFDINPGLGSRTAESWLTDVVGLAPR